MNSDEVRKYRSVKRRMVDSRVRFISPSQVEGRGRVDVEIQMRTNADKDRS